MTNDLGTASGTRTVPQLLALIFGVVYTLVGVIGFFYVEFENWVGSRGPEIFELFAVNNLHNVAHLAFGIAGIVMAKTLSSARAYGWALAVVFAVLFVYGLFVAEGDPGNILALNTADDWLHLLTALVGVAIATLPVNNRAGRV